MGSSITQPEARIPNGKVLREEFLGARGPLPKDVHADGQRSRDQSKRGQAGLERKSHLLDGAPGQLKVFMSGGRQSPRPDMSRHCSLKLCMVLGNILRYRLTRN